MRDIQIWEIIMITILLVLLSIVTLAMIGTILLQQSEGGGLTSGGAQSMAGMSARGAKNFMTRLTGILATIFMTLCVVLAILGGGIQKKQASSVIDAIQNMPQAPVSQ